MVSLDCSPVCGLRMDCGMRMRMCNGTDGCAYFPRLSFSDMQTFLKMHQSYIGSMILESPIDDFGFPLTLLYTRMWGHAC